jgi:hypothetical protein
LNKKIVLAKGTQEKLEAQAKAEGKTPDQLASEIVLDKTKGKSAEKKSETPVFPAKGMVNAYGFLHLSNGVAEAFGTSRGKKTPVIIDFKEGALIISKA